MDDSKIKPLNLFSNPPKLITSISNFKNSTLVSSFDSSITLYSTETYYTQKNDVPVLKSIFYDNKIIYGDIQGKFGVIDIDKKKPMTERISVKGITSLCEYKNMVIAAGFDGELIFIENYEVRDRKNLDSKILGLKIFDDLLCVTSNRFVKVLDLRIMKVIATINSEKEIRTSIINKNNVFIGFVDGSISINSISDQDIKKDKKVEIDLHSLKKETETFETITTGFPVNGLYYADKMLYSVGSDKRLRVVDLLNKKSRTLGIFEESGICICGDEDEKNIKIGVSISMEDDRFGKETIDGSIKVYSYD